MTKKQKYGIGTKFIIRDSFDKSTKTVVDVHTTYNSAGEVVEINYQYANTMMGETTIISISDSTLDYSRMLKAVKP